MCRGVVLSRHGSQRFQLWTPMPSESCPTQRQICSWRVDGSVPCCGFVNLQQQWCHIHKRVMMPFYSGSHGVGWLYVHVFWQLAPVACNSGCYLFAFWIISVALCPTCALIYGSDVGRSPYPRQKWSEMSQAQRQSPQRS